MSIYYSYGLTEHVARVIHYNMWHASIKPVHFNKEDFLLFFVRPYMVKERVKLLQVPSVSAEGMKTVPWFHRSCRTLNY